MAKTLYFTLRISPSEALRYYKGQARVVNVLTDAGLRIQFPAENIRPFITQAGVDGRFEISFDDNHKLIGIKQIT